MPLFLGQARGSESQPEGCKGWLARPDCQQEGSEGQLEGSWGQLEGSEGQLEGSECPPEGS